MTAPAPSASWDEFDAVSLFDETPRLHVNKVTYTDDPVDPAAESALSDTGHEDEVTVGLGDPSDEADERELQADTEEGTPPAGEQTPEDKSASDDSPAEASAEAGETGESEGQPEDADGSDAGSDGDVAPPESGPQGEDGAEKPIQQESEGVEDVAEATSKTSEDVHGGDEATKDIEDSQNAADDGQNPDNQGVEDGEGDETGEQTPEDKSASDDSPAEASAEAGETGESEGQPEDTNGSDAGSDGEATSPESGSQGGAEDSSDADPTSQENWEAHADQTALAQQVTDALAEVAAVRPATAAGGGAAVDYSGETWDVDHLRAVFFRTRELIKKLVLEEDFTAKEEGSSRWWAEELAMNAVSYRHAQIPSSRFDRPKTNNIVFFMDVSGSVSMLAELFMAIMGGAAGLPGVRIVVGSEAHAEREIVVDRPFRTVESAVRFFRKAVNTQDNWVRPYEQAFEPGVEEYLKVHGLYDMATTCVFFGDMQGVNFTTPKLRRLVRAVKCLWLFTDEPGHYTHTGDLERAAEAGLPIVYNVRSVQSFATAVKRLR